MNFLKILIKRISIRCKIKFKIVRMKFKNMNITSINRIKKIRHWKNTSRIMAKIKILSQTKRLNRLNLKPIKVL